MHDAESSHIWHSAAALKEERGPPEIAPCCERRICPQTGEQTGDIKKRATFQPACLPTHATHLALIILAS